MYYYKKFTKYPEHTQRVTPITEKVAAIPVINPLESFLEYF